MAFEITEEWYPMPPDMGPPLPRSMQIYWPWYKPPEVPKVPVVPTPPPEEIPEVPVIPTPPPEEVPKVPVVPTPPPEEIPEVPVIPTPPPEEVPEMPVVPVAPPEAVAEIRIENLTIQPKEVPADEPVTISVIARNYGGAPGSKTVSCDVNGKISTETVEVGAGERKPILFKVVPLEVKSYRVSVNGLIGTFKATAPEIDLGEIAIVGINGRPFKSARGGIGTLAEPITVSSLRGVTVNWRNKSVNFDKRLVGILFFMSYEGVYMTFPCEDGPGYRGIFKAGARRGTFEASTLINRDWAGGNWCPGMYKGNFMWRELYWDGDYRGGGDFWVSHFKCTGKGSYEPSPEIYPLV